MLRKSGVTEIFSLNHDSLFEAACLQAGLPLADGFGTPVNDVRYWEPDVWSDFNKVRLYKLHGSIDWYLLQSDSADHLDRRRIAIPLRGDPWHALAEDGELQAALPPRPVFLAGSENKLARYTEGLFFEIHARWLTSLQCANHLIICGYGFRDRGIDARIIEWMHGNRVRKLPVAHPNFDDLARFAQAPIHQYLREWKENGLVILVERYVQNLEEADILRLAGQR
jgi:hypothetical protein